MFPQATGPFKPVLSNEKMLSEVHVSPLTRAIDV